MYTQHHLIAQSQLIHERHIVVFEHVDGMPNSGEPWVSPELVVAICKKGWLRARYDMRPVTFAANDVTIIYPDHAIVPKEWSQDYDVTLIAVSSKWAKQQHLVFPIRHIFEHILYPDFHITNEQMAMVEHMVKVISDISSIRDEQVRDDLLCHQMQNLIHLLDYFRSAEPKSTLNTLPSTKRIAYRFYQDIVTYYKQSRETKFYADKQNLTAKYFGTTIYQTTGVHVSDWIARYIVTKAKILLINRPDLTISQIARSLGFVELTDFGRYFKRQAGISPAHFRQIASAGTE